MGPVGRGGVATVYRARHVDDPTREVALKLFEPSWRLSQAQLALGHFSNRELRIASQVDHPHLVRLAVGVAASVNQWVADWSAEPAESPDTQVVESGRIQGPD